MSPLTQLSTSDCAGVPHGQMAASEAMMQMDEVLEALNADETCRQSASRYANANSTSSAASMSGTIDMGPLSMFGGASMDAALSTQASRQASGAENMSEGCSQLVVQASEQINNARTITCEVQRSSNESSVVSSTNAVIRVQVKPECQHGPVENQPSNTWVRQNEDGTTETVVSEPSCITCNELSRQVYRLRADARMENLRLAADLSMAGMPEMAKQITKQNDSLNETFPLPYCGITLKDVEILNEGKGSILTSTKGSLQSNSDLKAAIKETVKSEAAAEINNDLGAGTNAPDTKTVISSKIESNSEDIATKIIDDMNKSTVTMGQNGEILILSPQGIVIEDSVLANTLEASITSESILSSAKSMGKKFGRDVIQDAVQGSTGSTETEKAELAALAAALGEANAKAIQAQMEGHKGIVGGMDPMKIVGGVLGVVVLFVVLKVVMGAVSGGGGGDATPQYDPLKCEGHESFPEKYGRYFKVVGMMSVVIKIQFVLFVLEQLRALKKHSTLIYMPWKWSELNLEQYVMNVVWSIVLLAIFCGFVHGTFNPFTCFGYNFTNRDPGNCYLRDAYPADGGFVAEDSYYEETPMYRRGVGVAPTTCRQTLAVTTRS